MKPKTEIRGIQHVGIPTNDIKKSIRFYQSLGFETAWQTTNPHNDEAVVFLQLGNLIMEIYENRQAVERCGAIDHIALDVADIDVLFKEIKEAGHRMLDEEVQYLPFWEHGVKFFTIIGPNEEKIEFCERLNGK